MSIRKLFVANSLSGGVQGIITALLTFISIPIFINKLGFEKYSAYSLIMVISSINMFVNFGFGNSLLRFLLKQGKSKESNYDIIVNITTQIILLFPIILISLIFKNYIICNILNIPTKLNYEANYVYTFLVFSNALNFIGQSFNSILDSLQLIYVRNILGTLNYSLNWLLIIIALINGYGLISVGFVTFLTTFIWFVLLSITACIKWGDFSIVGLRNQFVRILKKQLSYGFKLYIGGIINFFFEPISKILISNFLGINLVGYYEIALKIRNQIFNILGYLIYPINPIIGKTKQKTKISHIIEEMQQKILILLIPIISIAVVLMPQFISLWIGYNKTIIIYSSIILIVHLVAFTPIIPMIHFLVVKGYAAKIIYYHIINVLVNAIIFFVTYRWLGDYTIPIGYSFAIISSFVFYNILQKKYLDSIIFNSLKTISKISFTLFVNISIGILIKLLLSDALIKILIILPIQLITTILLYKYLNFFSTNEIEKYIGNNSKFAIIIKKIFIHKN